METILNTIRLITALVGGIAILAPVVRVLLNASRRPGRTTGRGSTLRRWPAVTLITLGFLAAGVLLWVPLPLSLPAWLEIGLAWVGFLLYLPAIGLYLWGLLTLGRDFGVSSASGAGLYAGQRLVKDGPYRFTRHPMYLAVLLAALGAFLIFHTWAMLVFLPLSLVVIHRAAKEEKLLALEFGEAWQAYARQVPMWFPRVSFQKLSFTKIVVSLVLTGLILAGIVRSVGAVLPQDLASALQERLVEQGVPVEQVSSLGENPLQLNIVLRSDSDTARRTPEDLWFGHLDYREAMLARRLWLLERSSGKTLLTYIWDLELDKSSWRMADGLSQDWFPHPLAVPDELPILPSKSPVQFLGTPTPSIPYPLPQETLLPASTPYP